MNKRLIGKEKEGLAVTFLEEKGYKILERNFYCRNGEIDIIALDGNILVFVEVKYRKTNSSGLAIEAVSASKIRKICKTSDYYRYMNKRFIGLQVRFDVIAIDGEDISHIENAFLYVGGGY